MSEAALCIGVAIVIPAPHAAVLDAWRCRVGDPSVQTIGPHVTLLPPTPIEPADLPDIDKHLADVARHARPFDVHLDGTGTFRPVTPVVFVRLARGADECAALESAIRRGPLDRELDFPFCPHVTVAQQLSEDALDAAAAGLTGFSARVDVGSFVLFARHREDEPWQYRQEFQLGL